jgi:hypothetical protein
MRSLPYAVAMLTTSCRKCGEASSVNSIRTEWRDRSC